MNGGGYETPSLSYPPLMADFRHIHCSSRFDRSAESLETALDTWMDECSLITLTEVANANRAAKLREKGWDYYNATQRGGRADDAAICWRKDTWHVKGRWLRRLYGSFKSTNQVLSGLWCSTVLLRHTGTGHLLLVSVSHMPHDVQAAGGFKTTGDAWQARKVAYQDGMRHWAAHIENLDRKRKPDAIIVCGDFNVGLNTDWFRAYMKDRWRKLDLRCAWKHFPTEGGSIHVQGRIIDGTFYHGMTTDGAELMPHDPSSDHRPYEETFTLGKTEKSDAKSGTDTPSGHTYKGVEWWGFGDYEDDELYELARATGEAGGEVL